MFSKTRGYPRLQHKKYNSASYYLIIPSQFEFRNTLIFSGFNSFFVLNENNIWAVGSLEAQDSAGQTQSFNAVHWNGSEWEYIAFVKENGYPISSIRGIGIISQKSFWLAAGSIYLWNDSIAILSYQRNINSMSFSLPNFG